MTRLEQLTQFLIATPNEPFIIYALAKEHEGLGNVDEALKYYFLLKNEHEDYVGTYYHLGKLLEKQEKLDEAVAIYIKGMEVAKKQGDNHAYSELAGAKLNLVDEDDY
jgi:tetratricopeptide (TPR) repeat protein